jgi:mono/diheme cytochrome c family protein
MPALLASYRRPSSRVTRGLILVAAFALTILASLEACGGAPVTRPTPAAPSVRDPAILVARGEYIVRTVSTCGSCHSGDPSRDPDGPLTGGMVFKDWRLGTIRAANLTPDSATGLGTWTDDDIVRALRTGAAPNGRLLAPAMPYEWFHEMSDEDGLAVARYLKSLAPMRNEVKQNPNLVFRVARLLFLGPKRDTPETAPSPGPTAAYGGYLAQHVALCAHCHTAVTGIQSNPDRRKLFAGDPHPPAAFPVNPSNLTPDSVTGIGAWSEADFVQTMRTGVNPAGRSLNAIMPCKQFRRMTADDLRAIYLYLRTLTPIR